jgi:methylthioribulose-1-phosphate dehydratase
MNPSDVILVNQDGEVAAPQGAKASAETLIHTAIYKKRPQVRAVLHTHSVPNTRLSLKHLANGYLNIQGYEMQKGLSGIKSHENVIRVPILANQQNMQMFSQTVEGLLDREPTLSGFLMAGHGLYTWGKDLAETKRHVETFEFLFDCLRHEEMGF